MPVVLYDACVLYSAQLRDLFMRLTLADLCLARWTDEILNEWSRATSEKHPHVSVESVARCRTLMNEHAPDALVTGYESLVPTLSLPDPNDCHVLAAAIHAQARVIVTFNLKDFPEEVLSFHGIEAVHPDEFLFRLIQNNLASVCAVVKSQRVVLKKPPIDADAFLNRLERQGLPQTAAILRTVSGLL
ncbi:PIN domain-containing protein [soil metagenome]